MQDLTKIATCCFCSSRTILRLRGGARHELSCAACGAPLHEMKPMKRQDPRPEPKSERKDVRTKTVRYEKPRRKPRKRSLYRLFTEILDEVEDIFD